jgi:hypothetical protein
MPVAVDHTSGPRRTAVRAVALLALLGALGGCVAAPVVAAPGSVGYGYGYSCYAGFYTCTLPAQGPVGSPCSCPGIGAPSYGTIR